MPSDFMEEKIMLVLRLNFLQELPFREENYLLYFNMVKKYKSFSLMIFMSLLIKLEQPCRVW
jgi:hypothetical protein